VPSHSIGRVNGDRAMSNLPNWAVGSSIIVLILLGPIIAFFVVIAAEMLTDVLTKEGMSAVCIVAAGAIGWSVFRSYRPQPDRSQLGSEEA
jgi:O-antigen/teichoic acid export membrane protein